MSQMRPICALLALFFPFHLSARESARDILKQCYKAIKTHGSVSYDIVFTFKGCDRPDTMWFYADASLLRVPTDKEFGGMIYVAPHDNTYTFYDLDKVYTVNKYRMTANVIKPAQGYSMVNGKQVKGKAIPTLGGNFIHAQVWNEFLKPAQYKKYINGQEVRRLADTVIQGHGCYEIYCRYWGPVNDERATILYIDQDDLIPIFRRQWVKVGETYEYSDFYLKYYSFDDVEKSHFSKKQIPNIYTIKE